MFSNHVTTCCMTYPVSISIGMAIVQLDMSGSHLFDVEVWKHDPLYFVVAACMLMTLSVFGDSGNQTWSKRSSRL